MEAPLTQPLLESFQRIAVLRANGLGDFLFATPALRALGKAFPDAEITYLCQPWLRTYVEGRYPYIHRILTVPPSPGIRSSYTDDVSAARERHEFFARCRAEGFDLAIQMHGGGVQSNPFLRQLGAKVTLGLTGRGVTRVDINQTYQFYQSEICRYLELVSRIGVPDDGLHMDAPELPGDVERLLVAWPNLPINQYLVVNPGASDARRHWPIDRFAAVAEHVYRTHGLACAVTGSLRERRLAQDLRSRVRTPIVDLTGQLDVGATVALLRRARLVVTNDTGLSNLAYAVDAPAVVIYWCGNLITAGPFTRRIFRPVLSWTLDCPACGQRACRCQVSFVQDAALSDVLCEVDDLLAPDLATPTGRQPVTIHGD